MQTFGVALVLLLLKIPVSVSNEQGTAWNGAIETDRTLLNHLSADERKKLSSSLSSKLNEILKNYDHRLRPNFYGPPVDIQIGMIVKGISSVSEVNMELETDFYFHQSWQDPRLKFNGTPPAPVLTLTHEQIANRIWQPDTYFPNEKNSRVHSATVENAFFRWYSSGQIIKSTRLTLTSTCPMNLENFPMDRQICGIELGSYGLTDADVRYFWKPDTAISMGPNAEKLLPQFTVLGHRRSNKTISYPVGSFTYLLCEFMFARSKNYYLIELYIPCILIVVISWFSFWMGTDAGGERIALGLTSMLTMTTLLLSAHSSSPKISYVKALDIYGGVCYAMVFASLLQSALVCYVLAKAQVISDGRGEQEEHGPCWLSNPACATYGSKSANYCARCSVKDTWRRVRSCVTLSRQSDRNTQDAELGNGSRPEPTVVPSLARWDCNGRAKGGDRLARIAFPLAFATFNGIYWGYYLNASKHRLSPDWVSVEH